MPRRATPTQRHATSRRTLLFGLGLVLSSSGGLSLFARSAHADPAGFRLVVHPENPTNRLERKVLARVFLREVTSWPGGEPIRPVDLKPNSPTRKHFSERVLNRSVAAVKSYWQQRIFSGRGIPPPELDGDQAVISYVTKHRGAVGYVSPSADLGAAKELRVD